MSGLLLVGNMPWDELVILAKENPTEFEKVRKRLIEECISESSPGNQKTLRALQVEANVAMDKHEDANGRLLAVASLSVTSLNREMVLLDNLTHRIVPEHKEDSDSREKGVVYLGSKRK